MGLHDGPIIKVNGKLEDIPVPSTPAPLPPTAETDVEDMGSQFMAEDIIRKHSEPAQQAQAQDYSPPPPPPTLGMPGVARKGRTPSPKSKQAAVGAGLAHQALQPQPQPMFSGPERWPKQLLPIAVVPEAIVAKKDKLDAYKENKQRISFVMESGTFMVSVVDLVATAYSIAVITAAESDACNFVPAIGSKFKLEVGSSCYDCIYPGSRATISELGIDILFLIREK